MKTYDHAWLIAEWERMGKPQCECLGVDNGEWEETIGKEPYWFDDVQYRIKCKPWIDWEHVSEDVMAMATDDDGDSSLFHGEPVKSSGWWHRDGEGFIVNPNIFASFTQGTCDWKDSLVMRPVVIGEEK